MSDKLEVSRFHDMSHAATTFVAFMGILRHADIRETLIYAPYSLDEGRTAMAKLDD